MWHGNKRRSWKLLKERMQSFDVRRWEIDFNGHANNLRYLDWISESLPAEVADSFLIYDFNIRFQKEVGLGAKVQVTTEEKEASGDSRKFVHEIQSREDGEAISCAETVWRQAST